MNNTDLKLVIALERAHNVFLSRLEKSLKSYALSVSEFGVLELLHHKGKQPVQKIAEKILVTSGTITYIIDKLIEKGFVIRERCSEDKRRFYIGLTEKGIVLISKVFSEHTANLNAWFDEMDAASKEMLTEKLFQLKESIEKNMT